MGLIDYILLSIAGAWFGSIEWRLRTMRDKQDSKPSRKEMKEILDLRERLLQQQHTDSKEDIKEIKKQLSKIYDIIVSGKK